MFTSSQIRRFAGRADQAIQSAYPVRLRIDGKIYLASGTGAIRTEDFGDFGGGAQPRGSYVFRLARFLIEGPPRIGALVELMPESPDGQPVSLTLLDLADHPHESHYRLRCEPHQR